MAFVGSVSIRRSFKTHNVSQTRKVAYCFRRTPSACTVPQQDAPISEAASSTTEITRDKSGSFLLSVDMISTITQGTMLEACALSRVYSSQVDGFSNETFFERQIPLGGVPSLLLGITESGITFGGYTANGFLARDDYRETSSKKSMFVFRVCDGKFLVAEATDLVLYDFYDYAVRFGAGLLCIPMNPAKHVMKANMATSNCRLPDGGTSLFGEYTMAKLKVVEVLVAAQYAEELDGKNKTSEKGFFAQLFG